MKLSFRRLSTFILILIAGITFTACGKDKDGGNCNTVTTAAPAAELTTLQQYLSSSNISATKDDRGFYYVITNGGTGEHPTICSNVTVNYSGKLTNGNQFDAGNNVSFPLNNLITGWQEGIPLIGKGGRIVLYLPPSLAYGNAAQSGIPANSILIFTIDLVSVQ